MKWCKGCEQFKEITEFHRHSMTADGYRPKCKACRKIEAAALRKRNLEYYLTYDRLRSCDPVRREYLSDVQRMARFWKRKRQGSTE